jgi:hypothetical protein
VILPSNVNTLPLVPTLIPISTGFNNPVGIDYHQPTNKVVMSVNYINGQPHNFELVAQDGSRTQFSNVAGLTDEVYIATARDEVGGKSIGGFVAGEMFTGSGVGGVIVRISPDGTTIRNPWVQLPGESGLLRSEPPGGELRLSLETEAVWSAFHGRLRAYVGRRVRAGADVELVDLRTERAHVAEALGVGFSTVERARRDRDLVLHASGSAAGLRTALDLAAAEGTIVELSWFGDTEVALPLGRDFHARRLTLRSSQVGTLSPRARRRHTRRSRLETALALLSDPALDVLVDGESDFFALAEIMPKLASPASAVLCHRLRYEPRTASS